MLTIRSKLVSILVVGSTALASACGIGKRERPNEDTAEKPPPAPLPDGAQSFSPDAIRILTDTRSRAMAADDDYVYFVDYESSTVRQIRTDGTDERQAGPYDGSRPLTLIQPAGDQVYWVYLGDVMVMEREKPGEVTQIKLPSPARVVAVGSEYVFAVGINCESPTRIHRETHEQKRLESPMLPSGGATNVTLDDEYLYCGTRDRIVRWSQDFESESVAFVPDGLGVLGPLLSDNEYIWWINNAAPEPIAFYRADKQTAEVERLFEAPRAGVGKMVTFPKETDCHFWSSGDAKLPNGYLGGACGDQLKWLLPERTVQGGIAANSTHLYWSEWDGIKMIEKSALGEL